jgi:ATP-binding cassette subfamily F protein 3
MINLVNINKSFGTRVLLKDVNLQLGSNEKLGLVGRNGHGKSTLFKILLHQENIDSGQIGIPKNYTLGYLEQHLIFKEKTVINEACLGLPQDEKDHIYKAEAVLFGLGFSKLDLQKSPLEFSGGYQIRLNLAKILISNPNLLLLDEPTNYLDIISIRWLIKFLKQWKNELILITHDRSFMDQVTTHTAMIHRCSVKKVAGPTQKLFDQIALEEEVYEKTRINDEIKKKEIEEFINRFRAKASKASMVQSRIKLLDSMPQNEKLADISSLDFNFNYVPIAAKEILKVENVSFQYSSDSKEIIKNCNFVLKKNDKIAIIGKNGKGKSTLLNIFAKKISPTIGTVTYHPQTQIAHFSQTHIPTLNPQLTIEDEIFHAHPELNKTQIRNICATMMFTQDDSQKKISVLSGGEKSRVLIGKLLAKPANLLLLDEPTNHLDMDSVETLMDSIKNFPGAAIIVTHDEELLREIPNKFIIFQNNTHDIFEGSYDDFLEKIGWEEENNLKTKNLGSQVPLHHLRSEIVKNKNKVLNKLNKEIEQTEALIMNAESDLAKVTLDLSNAIEQKNNQDITLFSKKIAELQKKVDETFLILESKHQQLTLEEQNFENQLNALKPVSD